MPSKQKARKTYVCAKCQQKINIGDEYWKHSFMYGPVVIHCNKHPFKRAELTHSDYLQTIYSLIDDESMAADMPSELEETRDEYVSTLEDLRSQCEDSLDNIPEQLRDADAGTLLQERIDRVDSAISDLEDIEFEDADEDEMKENNEQEEDELDEDYANRISDLLAEENADRVSDAASSIEEALANLEE